MTAILEITDGVQEDAINLINPDEGIHLQEWVRKVAVYRPIIQENEMQDGAQVVHRKFPLVDEKLTLDIDGFEQNDVIESASQLTVKLETAVKYWTDRRQTTKVYLRARASQEDGEQYALIHGYSLPELWNPYSQPFDSNEPAASDLELTLSREHWRAQPPGTGEGLYRNTSGVWRPAQEWLQASGSPPDVIYSFAEAANGHLLAGTNGEIWRSTDGGQNWAQVSTVPVDRIYTMLLLTSNTLLAADNTNIYRSIDHGANWSIVYSGLTNPSEHITEIGSGRVFAGTSDQLVYSDDDGQNWTAVGAPVNQSYLLIERSGVLYTFYADGRYLTSSDGGDNWSGPFTDVEFFQEGRGAFLGHTIANDGSIYVIGQDNGATFGFVYTLDVVDGTPEFSLRYRGLSANHGGTILSASDGSLYVLQRPAAPTVQVLRSVDGGYTWYVEDSFSGTAVAVGLFESSTNVVFVGAEISSVGAIRYKDISTIDIGAERSLSLLHYVANKHTRSNLTHIKYYDDSAGTYTDIPYPMSLPETFGLTGTTTDDIIYFFIDENIIDSGPISSLVFDLSTSFAFANATAWEYWDSAAWSALDVQDNTAEDGDSAFTRIGVRIVCFCQPDDWATTTVDGVTGYVVRVRFISPMGGSAEQQNRQIYAVNTPFIDIEADDITGEIPALLRVKAINVSDGDGPEGSGPDLYANRLLIASRDLSRGERFTPYLNLSDEQNEGDVTISLGTNTSFEADSEAPTGRRIRYNPAGTEAMADRVTIEFGPQLTGQYYGDFHVYLVARRTAGSATDLAVRLQFLSGSGGLTYTTENKNLNTSTAFEVLDFGQVTLPVTGHINPGEIADLTQIKVQSAAESGTPDLYLYELVLFPVDDEEWNIDVQDRANTSTSEIGRSGGNGKLLDVDSISDPREVVRCLVRFEEGEEVITANYAPISKSDAFLNERRNQRIWFLAMQSNQIDVSNPTWIARPEIVFKVDLYKNEGYLTMRGRN